MSVELPEAQILAEQMKAELIGKEFKSYQLYNYEKLQRIGFLNKDIKEFDKLVGRKIKDVISRGVLIRAQLDKGMNLLLAPEYGGKVRFHKTQHSIPTKLHFLTRFTDGTALTVRLMSLGLIYVVSDEDLDDVYIYKRDFSDIPSPLDEDFTLEKFVEALGEKNRVLKPFLVGKGAIVVGLSNSAFQDVLYRAKVHPKRKVKSLTPDEKRALYDSLRFVMKERLRLGGKDEFVDLHGNSGGYVPAMGPNMKDQECPNCARIIVKIQHGGGHVYFCSNCQK